MTFSNIDDFYVSDAELRQLSPSLVKHGVSYPDEQSLRSYGATLIWQACYRLELPMSVACTASVLLHRFYCKESLGDFDIRVMSAAVFWMACKLEEVIDCDDPSTLRLRDVLVMFYDCICRQGSLEDNTSMFLLNIYSEFYASFKEAVIKSERDLLRSFGFVMHVEKPIPFVLTLGAQLGLGSRKDILQTACNIASDSLRTTLCVRARAECVACAALFMAAQKHGYALPDDWWLGCGVEWTLMELCCSALVDLYEGVAEAKYASLSPTFLKFDPSNGPDAISVGGLNEERKR